MKAMHFECSRRCTGKGGSAALTLSHMSVMNLKVTLNKIRFKWSHDGVASDASRSCLKQNYLDHMRASRLIMNPHTQQSQPQRPRLIRRVQTPISPPHRSPLSKSCHVNLIQRVAAPISPPRTSPQQFNPDEDEGNEEDGESDQEREDSGQKRKQSCNSLRDALEEEVSRKKRKRGIMK